MASRLGDLLQRRGDLTAAQLTTALEAQREHSGALAYHLVKLNLISEEDLSLFKVTSSVDEAAEEISRFYRVYHSARTVGRDLVIRLARPLDRELVERLGREFADIVVTGSIVQRGALSAEADEPELAALPRLVFAFNRTNFGRLRQLIDRVNAG